MGKNVVEVEKKLLKVVSVELKVDVRRWRILQNRYNCFMLKPCCDACIIEVKCDLKEKTE
jgi:endonuclease-3